jgi:serine/threonine-protein phosphatase 6 regulatory ankyrin repeat subunit B
VNFRNKTGFRPLHQAAKNNFFDIFKILYKYGADLNSLDFTGRSSLHYTIINNGIDIVKFLVEKNVEID